MQAGCDRWLRGLAALLVSGVSGGVANGGEAPARFKATALSGSEIELSWERPADVSSYGLQRRGIDREEWQNLAPPAAGDQVYSDAALALATRYEYRLTTLFADGSRASVTTPVTPTQSDGILLFSARNDSTTAPRRAMVLDAWGVRRFGRTAIADLPSLLGPNLPSLLSSDLPGGLWFTAASAAGSEPWWFDGEVARQVADIEPGPGSSAPGAPIAWRGGAMFAANTAQFGRELYSYFGDEVRLTADLEPGSASSRPHGGIAAGDRFYFQARTTEHGHEPWVWDGVEARVLELVPGSREAIFRRFGPVFGDAVVTVVLVAGELELWAIREAGAIRIAGLEIGGREPLLGLVDVHADALYIALGGESGGDRWQLRRLPSGGGSLQTLLDEASDEAGDLPREFIRVGDRAYFAAETDAHGSELWMIDAAGELTVIDSLRPGAPSSYSGPAVPVGDRLYYEASSEGTTLGLWRHDGLSAPVRIDGSDGMRPLFPFGEDKLLAIRDGGTELVTIDVATDAIGEHATLDQQFGTERSFTELPAGVYVTTRANKVTLAWFVGFDGAATLLPLGFDRYRTQDEIMRRIGDLGYILAAPPEDPDARAFRSFDGLSFEAVPFEPAPGDGLLPKSGFSRTGSLAAFAGGLAFSGARDEQGEELWFDDRRSGPALVADLWPGQASSSPRDLVAVGDVLFFSACTEAHGRELWSWDGSAAPQRLTDIAAGPGSSEPRLIREFGGAVYFAATDVEGESLWRLGAGGALERLMSAAQTTDLDHRESFTTVGGEHFFITRGADGTAVWRVDATGALGVVPLPPLFANRYDLELFTDGTSLLLEFNQQIDVLEEDGSVSDFAPGSIIETFEWRGAMHAYYFRGKGAVVRLENGAVEEVFDVPSPGRGFVAGDEVLYFAAVDNLSGEYSIWQYRHGDPAPVRCDEVVGAPEWTDPLGLTTLADDLFFIANANGERELWSKAEAGGVGIATDLNPGWYPIDPTPQEGGAVRAHGKRAFFIGASGLGSGGNAGLWSARGITDFPVRSLHHFADQFLYSSSVSGSEDDPLIWRSVSAATGEVSDLPARGFGGWSDDVVEWRGRGYFTAHDAPHGWELWCYDGAEPSLLFDIYPGHGSGVRSNPVGGSSTLFFVAAHPDSGDEIWRWDGQAAEPSLLFETSPGGGSFNPSLLGVVGDTPYFVVRTPAGAVEIGYFDQASGAVYLDSPATGDLAPFANGLEYRGAFYFGADDGQSGTELWRHRPGDSAAEIVWDVEPGPAASAPQEFSVFNGRLYFTASAKSVGRELWVYDGSEVRLAADLAGFAFRASDFGPLWGNPQEFSHATLGNAPAAILIDNTSIVENRPAGSEVGSLSAVDADGELDAHLFQLIPGEGDESNALYAIVEGNRLVTAAPFDYESGETSHRIRIRASDREGRVIEAPFVVGVEDEPPFREWIAGFFPVSSNDPSVFAPTADTDRDGSAHVIEYLFGTSPVSAGARPQFDVGLGGGGSVVLQFDLPNPRPADALLAIEGNATLGVNDWRPLAWQNTPGEWQTAPGVKVETSAPDGESAAVTITLERLAEAVFLRLRGELIPGV